MVGEEFPEKPPMNVDPRSFWALVENAGHSIYCTAPDGTIVYVNPAFEEQTGYDEEEAVGRNASILQSGVHDEAFYAELWETILDGNVWEGEIINERKNGERYAVKQTISPITDESGEIVQFVAVNEDITELREYQEKLESERDRFAALLNAVPAPLVLVNFDGTDAVIKRVNEAFVETFGGSRRGLIGNSLDEYIVTDDESNQSRKINEMLRRGDPVRHEVTRETAHGEERTFLLEATPFGTNGNEALGTYTDITDRKRAEERRRLLIEVSRAIRDAETFPASLERMLETICEFTEWTCGEAWVPADETEVLEYAVGYSDVDECRRFVAESQSMTFPPGEGLPGRVHASKSNEWIPDVSREPTGVFHRKELAAAVGLRAGFGVPLATEEGVVAVLTFFLRDRRDHDEKLIENVSDVVESVAGQVVRKRTEDLLKRQNERLQEFADVLSHDLRNPLNVAEGHLELLTAEREDETSDREADHIDAIAAAHSRMEELIDDVLMLARQGNGVDETTSLDLDECVRRTWENTETRNANLDLETTHVICGDESRLRRLLGNLIRNAVEHGSTSPHEDVGNEHDRESVTITVGDLPEGFYVADDGPGIPEEKRDEVFASGYTSREDGTGLGLSIVQKIAEAHGWTVTVTESDAGGARFEITDVELVDQ
ncbi:PAS domain S-box protein [Halopenitus sp. H-Gu1]|uniref:PAS domain S-box protein n=1 Tax=Halopenitus sp. H-Gu1 TaxID=3242697 RepID=UPI00359EB549